MNNLNIIMLEPARWQEYRELRLRSLDREPTAFGTSYEEDVHRPENEWRDRLEAALKKAGSLILFAEIDGKLVGMIVAHWVNRIKMAHIAGVYGFYVDQPMRGRGIGQQLMQALIEEISCVPQIEKLRLGVNTQQAAAIALYKKAGFEIVGTVRKELKIDDQYYDEYLMEKYL
jgi:RimJ/RimL family protein N-acetyltransferase